MPMKKFTITHETAGGSSEPLMDKCVSVLNSKYSIAFEQLFYLNYYACYNVDDGDDLSYKVDMKRYGFKASFLFLMKQADGSDEGFLGINFDHTEVLQDDRKDVVREQIPNILCQLNMKDECLAEN
jgi:hypothetical protein